MSNALMAAVGLSLIIIGLLLIFIASASRSGRMKGGGVVLIGPFPIIFGGENLKFVVMVFVVLFAVLFALFILLPWLVGVGT